MNDRYESLNSVLGLIYIYIYFISILEHNFPPATISPKVPNSEQSNRFSTIPSYAVFQLFVCALLKRYSSLKFNWFFWLRKHFDKDGDGAFLASSNARKFWTLSAGMLFNRTFLLTCKFWVSLFSRTLRTKFKHSTGFMFWQHTMFHHSPINGQCFFF